MSKLKKRILSFTLAIVLTLTMIPMFGIFAFAATASPINVYLSVSSRGEIATANNGDLMAWKSVRVTDANKDGKLTYDEAMVAAHKSFKTADDYATTSAGYVTKIWGVETSNATFYVDSVPFSTAVTEAVIEDGDYLVAAIHADDVLYSDHFSYFDKTNVYVLAGEEFSMNLNAFSVFGGEPEALAGAAIGYYDAEGSYAALDVTTDENGSATISFPQAGLYILTASGAVQDVETTWWSLMNMGGNPPSYGTMDMDDPMDAFVAYTDEDHGNGPYPYDEIKFLDFWEWNEMEEEEQAPYHVLHSNQVITDAPIVAPVCIVNVGLNPDDVYLSVSNQGQFAKANDGSLMNRKVVTVEDLNYDAKFSVDEVLVAGHKAYNSEDGYAAPTGYVNKLWGVETTNNLFFVNGVGLSEGVTGDFVSAGDLVYASVNKDQTYYSDCYSFFDQEELAGVVGQAFTLNLQGFSGMMGFEAEPLAGAALGYYSETGEFVDLGVVTDDTGNATFAFGEPGTYQISASGNAKGIEVTSFGLMNLGGNPPVYGTMDFETYESNVAYTEEDYGNGPYPIEEIQYMDFYEWRALDEDELEDVHALHSPQILVNAPIMATDICTVTVNELPYSGDKVKFVKQDLTSEFGMLTPVAGSTFKIEGDNVVMHIIPSMGKKTYGWIHWGTILDAELTQDITIQDDDGLYFDITVPKTMCGKAIPIAPIKVKDGGTSSAQYYLAIPEEDAFAPADYSAVDAALAKVPSDLSVYAEVTVEPLTDAINAVQRDLLIGEQDKVDAMAAAIEAALKGLMQDIDRIPYDGSEVNFAKEDGTQFGMFTPQSGTTISYNDENITIHYVPKNKTVYKALHVGGILDGTLSEDHPFNEDGTMDLVFPIELAGWGIPVAPIKKSDGGTTKDQYFLMIPTEENLVQGVIDAIEDLPPASELTLDDKADVIAARQAYDTLSEEDKAELDPILETQLELAEATIENLESQNTIADLEQQLEEARAELEAAKEQLAKTPGWHKNDDGSWYFCDNKGETVKGWLSDGGKWYFMDKETGIMQTGWVKDGSTWYYMSGSGAMVTGWQKVGDTWYFFKSSGAMAANEWCEGYWLNANGSWTYQPKGSWKKNNQGWWFGDTSGWYAKNTTQKIDGTNYKFNAAGYWVQ